MLRIERFEKMIMNGEVYKDMEKKKKKPAIACSTHRAGVCMVWNIHSLH
jgi:hypothetical protein